MTFQSFSPAQIQPKCLIQTLLPTGYSIRLFLSVSNT